MVPRHCEDEVLIALDETYYRWVAWRRAVAAAGPDPDEDTFFALIELQFAADHWKERFLAGLARRGVCLEEILAAAR